MSVFMAQAETKNLFFYYGTDAGRRSSSTWQKLKLEFLIIVQCLVYDKFKGINHFHANGEQLTTLYPRSSWNS